MPAEISYLAKLQELVLGTFRLFFCSIPYICTRKLFKLNDVHSRSDIVSLLTFEFNKLHTFHLNTCVAYNDFTGSLATQLVKLSNLSSLDISNNHLTGSIPDAIGDMSKLTSLTLVSFHVCHGPTTYVRVCMHRNLRTWHQLTELVTFDLYIVVQ